MNRQVSRGRGDCDRGSASVELVVVTPLLVLLFLVVVALGRLADARLIVVDAAHQAARAASLARTEGDARDQAERVASTALRVGGASCTHLVIRLTTGSLTPGAGVKATVSCTVDLEELTSTGMPGHVTLTSAALSAVDTFRSTP